jgi:riboflavin-specific deaminase-like protein
MARSPRPFVLLNLAMTADGCIANASREIHSFGSSRDQHHLFVLRATADAVLCGARTVRESPVDLTAGSERFRRERLKHGLAEQPLRIVVTRTGRLPQKSRIFRPSGAPLLVIACAKTPRHRLRELRARGVQCAQFGTDSVDLVAALGWLRSRHAVRRLLVEGGGRLVAALLDAGLIDELHLTLCPFLFGGTASPSIADGPGAVPLSRALSAGLLSARRAGDELFLRYTLRSGILSSPRHQPEQV